MKETDFEIRKEQVYANVPQPFSVLYLSDFHFNSYSRKVAKWMIDRVNELQPDLILLGGDYVDTWRGMQELEFFLEGISMHKNIFAIGGNHDYFFGINKIKNAFEQKGVEWMEKDTKSIYLKGTQIQIDGNQVSKKLNTSDFTILCVHNTAVLNADLNPYNLAFAGHLHGSQFVFWENKKGLYPGRLFYKWNVLSRTVNNCICLISKGLGDTLPFRYNCKKDMIFVEVLSN